MPFLSHRRREAEWMDRPDADPAALEESLDFIRRVNRRLGYTWATLSHLSRFSRGWQRGQPIRILDLATGSADIPIAMVAWGRKIGFDLRVTAVDFHDHTLAVARKQLQAFEAQPEGNPDLGGVTLVRADVFALPFDAGSFDYVTTHMFLHHLDEAQVEAVLRTMGRMAGRGVIIADLLRSYRAYAWIKLFTMFSTPMVRHDAAVSVGQAFTRGEILRVREEAGLNYARYYRHFGHRFVLAGEKTGR